LEKEVLLIDEALFVQCFEVTKHCKSAKYCFIIITIIFTSEWTVSGEENGQDSVSFFSFQFLAGHFSSAE